MVDGIVQVISKPEFLEVILTFIITLAELIISLVKTNLKYWQSLTVLQVQEPMTVR